MLAGICAPLPLMRATWMELHAMAVKVELSADTYRALKMPSSRQNKMGMIEGIYGECMGMILLICTLHAGWRKMCSFTCADD